MTAMIANGHADSSETSKKAFAAPELVAAACARALAAEKRSKSQAAELKPQNQGLPLFSLHALLFHGNSGAHS